MEQEQANNDDSLSETIKNLQVTEIDKDYISNLLHSDATSSCGTTNGSLRSKIDKDYISKLPYDVLERIVSIHPRDSGSKAVAVFTGLVDRPCIKHVGRTVKIQDFETEISDLFFYYDKTNPLKAPRNLEFHFTKQMIVTASIGLNKRLNLDFSKVNQEYPGQLGGWEIMNNTMRLALSPKYPYCNIKSLKLTSIKHLSHELVSHMIYKFPDVECFIIEKCNGLSSWRVEGFYGLMDLRVLDCVGIESVYVEALELRSLKCSGSLCLFTFNGVVYLKDVKLDCIRPGFNHLNHGLFNPLLRAIQGVKVLTIHGWMFKEVFGPLLCKEDTNQHFRFSELRDLWWIDSCMEEDSINSLFCFLKFCTSLRRLFITIDPRSYSRRGPFTGDHKSSIKVKKTPLRKLKLVKLEGFKNDEEVMFFKEHMMEVFNVEPRLVEMREGMQTRCLIRIPKRQALGKATKSNKLKFCYKFVEEVEDNIGLCSKHPHMA